VEERAGRATGYLRRELRRLREPPPQPWELDGGDHPVFSPDGTILFRSYQRDDTKQSDY
jgi:hypothetical protein